MKQQTALTTLIDYYNDVVSKKGDTLTSYEVLQKVIRKAAELKEMEKEQIIQSWHNGYDNKSPMIDEVNCGNTYYNETYGQ
jgi:hypothetical protein